MDQKRRGLYLLAHADWGEDTALMTRLRQWRHYSLLTDALAGLKVEALYKSAVHGSGHINRVLLLAGLLACLEELPEDLLRQYLLIAAYHDVGRSFDGLEPEHGTASAGRLEELTGCRGEPLLEMQGAVKAHSQPDERMAALVRSCGPSDVPRAVKLALLLKDADNLDRVRLGDLNVNYLRHANAKALAPFAGRLFRLDQAYRDAFRQKE